MTPQQYLAAQLTTLLTTNNPNASAASIVLLSNELAGLWANLILPNLQVNLTTGTISFIVPTS